MNENRNIERGIEFLTRKMDEERVVTPDSLSEAKVREMIAREKMSAEASATKPVYGAADTYSATDAYNEGFAEQEQRPAIVQEVIDASKEAEAASAAWTAKKRKKTRRRAMSLIAACMVVMIGSWAVLNNAGWLRGKEDPVDYTGKTGASSGADGLVSFASYDELDDFITDFRKARDDYYGSSRKSIFGFGGGEVMKEASPAAMEEDMAVAEEAPAMTSDGVVGNSEVASANSADADGSHSDTYKQVEGVDEADIVKTDGKYIYYLKRGGDIGIVRADKGETTEVAKIEPQDADYRENFSNFFLLGDTLAVVGGRYENRYDGPIDYSSDVIVDEAVPVDEVEKSESAETSATDDGSEFTTEEPAVTDSGEILPDGDELAAEDEKVYNGAFVPVSERAFVKVYDISDRTSPKEKFTYEQSGYAVSSRMVGKYLYLVSNDYMYESNVPWCTGKDGGMDKLAIENIKAFPSPSSESYVIVAAVDTASDSSAIKSETKAVLGSSNTIYCTTDTLYVTAETYGESGGRMQYGGSVNTAVLRASLDSGKIEFTGTGKVRGYVYGQWAMDARDGYFRIATTSSKSGKDVNNLFVLDKDMNVIGSVTGFANDEHIEAVRFIGEKAYVITYKQTDPLFIIDLSDPAKPKIEGEVKITGFSTLLHPISSTELLGIGYAIEIVNEEYETEATNGMKLALFDISDPANPKIADSKEFAGIWSEAQDDHRAFVVNSDKGYFAVPFTQYWDAEGEDYAVGGILVFRVYNGKIEVLGRLGGDEEICRAVYIDDYIYGITYGDRIVSYKVNF